MGLSTFDVFKNINADNSAGLKVLNDDELHQLQKVLFEMLIDLDAFFKKNGIEYSLAGGSALGVIRHGGFIPWDDDVDLLMTRRNYEKLKQCFVKEKGKEYWFHTPEHTKNYGLGFARIRKKGTVCRSRDDVHNEECGVYIDIFLMENTYDSAIFRKIHGMLSMACGFAYSCRRFWAYRDINMSLVKGNKEAEKVFRKKMFIGRLVSFISLDGWTHLWNKVNSMCGNEKSKYVTVPCGRRHFFKEMYDRKWACRMEPCNFTFDGKTVNFSLMKGARNYLTKMYGDYMKMPNSEDIEKHILLELKF